MRSVDTCVAGTCWLPTRAAYWRQRLHGRKSTGGKVEVLLLKPLDEDACAWVCLMRGHGIGLGMQISDTFADRSDAGSTER